MRAGYILPSHGIDFIHTFLIRPKLALDELPGGPAVGMLLEQLRDSGDSHPTERLVLHKVTKRPEFRDDGTEFFHVHFLIVILVSRVEDVVHQTDTFRVLFHACLERLARVHDTLLELGER